MVAEKDFNGGYARFDYLRFGQICEGIKQRFIKKQHLRVILAAPEVLEKMRFEQQRFRRGLDIWKECRHLLRYDGKRISDKQIAEGSRAYTRVINIPVNIPPSSKDKFFQVPRRALRHIIRGKTNSSEAVVLLYCFSRYMRSRGYGLITAKDISGLSASSVQRAVKSLEAEGWIRSRRTKRGWRINYGWLLKLSEEDYKKRLVTTQKVTEQSAKNDRSITNPCYQTPINHDGNGSQKEKRISSLPDHIENISELGTPQRRREVLGAYVKRGYLSNDEYGTLRFATAYLYVKSQAAAGRCRNHGAYLRKVVKDEEHIIPQHFEDEARRLLKPPRAPKTPPPHERELKTGTTNQPISAGGIISNVQAQLGFGNEGAEQG